MGKIIGIDLGTTNSVVAIMEGREPKVIVNEEGARTTPSVVAWDDKGEVLVGQIAKRQAVTNPENTIFSAKRFIGRRFDEVTEEIKRVPYKVVRANNGDCAFVVRGKNVSPPETSARVLMKLKKAAEDYLGEKVTEAVITVPAYFNDAQRQATKDAGRIAGLDVKRIVNEPTAAALAYGLDKKKDEVIAVYDFGGGTFDISILEVGDNVVQVISTNGDTHLGGDDIDNLIIDWMVAEFKKANAVDLRNDKMALQRLKEAAEKAKIELSSVQETGINLPFITVGRGRPDAPRHAAVSREARADDRTRSSSARWSLCGKALARREEEPERDRRGRPRRRLDPHSAREGDGEEVLRQGSAQGRQSRRSRRGRRRGAGGRPLGRREGPGAARRDPAHPRRRDARRRDDRDDPAQHDDPHAEEGDLLDGDRQPAQRSRFTSCRASGPSRKYNRTLGKFHLEGIMPAPRGVPKVEVTFDIDANGILNVSAKDTATGKDQKITITANSGLNEEEIQKMVKDAAEHEREDKERREQIERRNKLDNLCYTLEKTLNENKDKVPAPDFATLEGLIKEGREAVEKQDDARVQDVTERLEKEAHRLASVMYGVSGSPGGPGGGPGADGTNGGPMPPNEGDKKGKEGGVIDAEFEETGG